MKAQGGHSVEAHAAGAVGATVATSAARLQPDSAAPSRSAQLAVSSQVPSHEGLSTVQEADSSCGGVTREEPARLTDAAVAVRRPVELHSPTIEQLALLLRPEPNSRSAASAAVADAPELTSDGQMEMQRSALLAELCLLRSRCAALKHALAQPHAPR